MSQPYEDSLDDLFDFPPVDGLEEFGLVPPAPADALLAAQAAAEAPVANNVDSVADDSSSDASTGSFDGTSEEPKGAEARAPRENPPVPEGIDDLDEDLFHFEEIFSLEDDPYHNGTLKEDGQPAVPVAPAPAPMESAPQPAPVAQAAPQPTPPVAPPVAPQAAYEQPPPAPQQQASPQPNAEQAQRPSQQPYAAHTAAPERPAFGHAAAGPEGHPVPMLRDRGPRILLPEDIPYTQSSENKRTLAILVGCFLAINTGIFFLAQQASSNFQATLNQTTGILAEAIVQGKDGAPTSASVPVQPQVTYVTEERPAEPAGPRVPYVDPRDYANTHEIAVGSAKSMLAEGQFEDARRLLNHVLANQARIPLSPSLREEIDYLIPLTYFEQGNATAPSKERSGENQ